VIIASRFNGPPNSGNGGYTAGLVASHVDGGQRGVRVRLHRPPPLDTEMSVRGGEVVKVYAAEDLIAEATADAVDDAVVPGVPYADAVTASPSYPGFVAHLFPTCFACGPLREDGLRLFPGRLPDGRTAAPFVVPADISSVLVWASLDCPGGWAVPLEARPYVLGQMTARVDAVPVPGDECVVMGEMTGEDGRKAYVRSTLFGPTGTVLATARATWLVLPSA